MDMPAACRLVLNFMLDTLIVALVWVVFVNIKINFNIDSP